MLWITLKWLAGLLVLATATPVIAGQFNTKTFHVETFIAAPPEKVWAVLMDNERYPEWNPTFIKIEGAYKQGAIVTSHVQEPAKVTTIKAKVKEVIPNRLLNQTGGLPGVITFDHRWELHATEGGTKVIQHEIDRGFYLWFWDSSWVQPAYERTSKALKERVMSLQ